MFLQLSAATFAPFALNCATEAIVSIKRIEEFLLKEEKTKCEQGLKHHSSMNILNTTDRTNDHILVNAVELNDVSASWEEDNNQNTLQNINLKIRSGQLCAFIGPVGAGKVVFFICVTNQN